MAPIDPQYSLDLARQVADIYGDAADTMMDKVTRRLARGITSEGWAQQKRAQILRLRDEISEEIRKLEGKGPKAAGQAVQTAYDAGLKAAQQEPGIGAAFIGINRQAIEKLASETMGLVESTHLQIARSVMDAYRDVITHTSLRGVITGTQSRREAAQSALDRFADRGISGFTDKSGANWELESYVEMATRTGSGHAFIEGRLDGYRARGRTLVIVTSAPHPCEFCQPWEGNVLSIDDDGSGGDLYSGEGYPSVEDATSSGLFHPN